MGLVRVRGVEVGHLPGPLGRPGQRREPGAAVPRPRADARAQPARRRAARGPARPARPGHLLGRGSGVADRHRRPARADARGDRVPDRGHGDRRRQPPRGRDRDQRRPRARRRARSGCAGSGSARRRRRGGAGGTGSDRDEARAGLDGERGDRRRQLRRGELAADPQVGDHLCRDPRDRADDPAPRTQAARALPGSLRAQPGRSQGPLPAARRRRQAAQQGELQAGGGGADPLGDRPRPGHPQRHRDAGDHPLRRRRRRQGRPLRNRRLDRDPLRLRLRIDLLLRPAAGRLVVRLEVQLHGRDAVRGSADLLRDLDGAGAARRDHDGRVAQPGRHRQCPGRRPPGTSSPSSSAS